MKSVDVLKRYLWNIKEFFVFSNFFRDKKIVLFGSWFGEKFADNSRYLFQYVDANKRELGLEHVVWVTRNQVVYNELIAMGYETYMMNTPESIYFHRKAKIHVVCESFSDTKITNLNDSTTDILCRYSLGAKRINLWHGIPAKGVNFSSLQYKKNLEKGTIKVRIKDMFYKNLFFRRILFKPGGWGDYYMLSTTPFITKLFREMMYLPESRMIESNYPRNKEVPQLLSSEKDVLQKIKASGFSILYLPTFRESLSEYISPFHEDVLSEWLTRSNSIWIQKKHSGDKQGMFKEKISDDHIISLSSDFDINVLLPLVDVVVTDYSSVCFDAIYHRKVVLFYVPDMEYYMNADRGFVMSPDEFMVGPKSFTPEALVKELNNAKINPEGTKAKHYEQFRNKVWGEDKTIKQIWEDIYKKVGLLN